MTPHQPPTVETPNVQDRLTQLQIAQLERAQAEERRPFWKKAANYSWLVSLLLGSGLLVTFWSERKAQDRADTEARRAEAQTRKAELTTEIAYLNRVQFLLARNSLLFHDLTEGLDFQRLEYAPDYIFQAVRSRYGADASGLQLWKQRLQTLLDNNKEVVDLLTKDISTVTSEALRASLGQFVQHAQAFADLWRSLAGDLPPPGGRAKPDTLLVPAFPAQLDAEVDRTLQRLREQLALASAKENSR